MHEIRVLPNYDATWNYGVSWLARPPKHRPDMMRRPLREGETPTPWMVANRRREIALTALLKRKFRPAQNIDQLQQAYRANMEYGHQVAERSFPRFHNSMNVFTCYAAAVGIRYIEMVVGSYIPVVQLFDAKKGLNLEQKPEAYIIQEFCAVLHP